MSKVLNNERDMLKAYGVARTQKLKARLSELNAATHLGEVPHIPPARLHALKGDRQGQFSVDLDHPFRLIFEPDHTHLPMLSCGGPDLSKITRIKILEVSDPH